eukprot:3636795-Ditylum_brightwellii.AAC.1
MILNGKNREGRGGLWKTRNNKDVIRVPSTRCDDDGDEVDDGRKKKKYHGRNKINRKRTRRRREEENRQSDQSFNAAPNIGPGATTAFPRGFCDGRILESRQRRQEEKLEEADGGFIMYYDKERLPSSLMRRNRAPLENVVRVVDEGN